MDLNVKIQLPVLWSGTFEKNKWGYVNYLVGPNGTGKTLFATELRRHCREQGLRVRYLSAERLAGLERERYGQFSSTELHEGFSIRQYHQYKSTANQHGLSGDGFILLNDKVDLRIRVEATLSQLFDRELTLSVETGSLQPRMRRKKSDTYDMRQHECHGLKELITILAFLYDDDNDSMIIDEPELHLHPQFQMFLLQHIRQLAGDPRTTSGTKCFFLITHSPYMVDVRTIDDLRHCLVFHHDLPPSYVNSLDGDDEYKVKRLLPRLNTHHKQFFFSSAPIFVEGYTDQQILTLIQEKRDRLIGAMGACLIDVSGKDELAVFYRLCKRLDIDGRFIADLDVLFSGSLRQLVSQDERCKSYLQEHGLGVDGMGVIGQLEKPLGECIDALQTVILSESSPTTVVRLQEALRDISGVGDTGKAAARKRYIVMVGVLRFGSDLAGVIPGKAGVLNFLRGRTAHIIEGFKKSGVYILEFGELENYLPSYNGNPFSVSNDAKAEVFERERTLLLDEPLDDDETHARYGNLIDILEEVSSVPKVSIDIPLSYRLADWVHKVQVAFLRNAPSDADILKKDPLVEWGAYSRLFDVVSFGPSRDGFSCCIKLLPHVDPLQRELSFTGQDVPSNVVKKIIHGIAEA